MFFNKNNYSIYYEKYGTSKNNILILPGWGDTRKTFYNMINNLKNNNTIYIIDYPGFGLSEFPNDDLTIYDYTNIIRDFIKEYNIINPTIIAHSFGGRIATLLTAYYKDNINKLVLIDIAGIKPKNNIFKIMKKILYKLLKKISIIIPKNKRNIYLKKIFNIFASTDYQTLNNNMRNTFKNIVNEDLKYYIKEINNETLIIWGKKDKDTKIKDALYMKKNIMNSKLYILPNAKHFSYLEYPDIVITLINDFIQNKNT